MIEVYTKTNCKWCVLAKKELEKRNIPYIEKVYGIDFSRKELIERLKHDTNFSLTLPQIFDNLNSIGGYEQLVNMLVKQDEENDFTRNS